jgi:hypothetical protein
MLAFHLALELLINFLQIDSIDPAFAPATGTPETGGELMLQHHLVDKLSYRKAGLHASYAPS